ncbi:hypothetical protein [Streptacidiphilus rugosus]|uniref:hypothetical protein n=1 Tax=Streptacidiphilus rugosus TaxID=405783 RepID=UPI000689C826|nr:hypothetical protein [Streptacidiphilus rugosus]
MNESNAILRAPRASRVRAAAGRSVTVLAGLGALVGGLAVASPAHAVTPVPCSATALTAAINAANANAGGTVTLTPGCVYDFLQPPAPGAGAALPTITSPITVNGNGATIQRDPSAPLFRLLDIGDHGRLTAGVLTLKGGHTAPLSSGQDAGGAVLVETGGALYGSGLTVTHNAATEGGGIMNAAGATATLNASTVSDNTAQNSGSGVGGGISNNGTLTLTASRLQNNQADFAGGGFDQDSGTSSIDGTVISGNTADYGGGIDHDGGPVTVTASSVDNNRGTAADATGAGGGIWNDAPLTISASAITHNQASDPTGSAGGIANESGATLVLKVSSISANTAGGQAGGLYNSDAGTTATLYLSSVTGNTSGTGPGGVFNSATVHNTFSVIQGNTPSNCKGSLNSVPGCVN